MDNNLSQSELNNAQPDCDQLQDLLPVYLIGAADDDEVALVESLLKVCSEVSSEAMDTAALLSGLNLSIPRVEPSADLHDRIMAAARRSTPPQQWTAPQAEMIPPVHHVQPTPPLRIVKPAAPPDEPTASMPTIRRTVFLFALSAAAALLLISNVFWANQVNMLNERMTDSLRLLRDQDDLVAALATDPDNVQRLELVSTAGNDEAPLVSVLWSSEFESAFAFTDELPALPADRTYQLWLISGDQPQSAGTFQINERGQGILIFESDTPIPSFDTIGISEEPAGGSPAPTSDPIAAAPV